MNDPLRTFTRQLAMTFASDEGALTIARLQRAALAASRTPPPERPDGGLRLGIWDPIATSDGALEFVRSGDTASEWRYWADVERIPRKQGSRVVLVGESVARAYLFDPEITLAAMLEASLGVEVLDLARTDLNAAQLPLLFDALPALEPDAVVLFAGNNWSSVRLELEDLERLASAIRDGGFVRCRATFLELVRRQAQSTLSAIAARLEGAPLCVVIPEFNLRDWRSEPGVVAPMLGDVERWLELATEGRPTEMIALDEGGSAESQQMAAELALARGDVADARRHFEAARDAHCGLMIAHSPRCPALVQQELRDAAAAHGFLLVDLPHLFGPLPDRRLFLDYCHLTGEGLRLAASAIASTLAPLLHVTVAAPPEPPPEVSARAHLLAAVHNAHYGQPADVVRHHARVASQLDPPLRALAGALVKCVSRATEPWLSTAWDFLRREAQIQRYLGAPEMLRAPRVADVILADAVASAFDLGDVVDRVLLEESAALPLDLLSPRHRAATFREAVGQGLGPPTGFVRATGRVSRFFLVRAATEKVTARVTLRADGEVCVAVNGVRSEVVPAEPRWRTFELPIVLRAGRNVVELQWPVPRPDVHVAYERAARRLERGLYPEVLIAFGEVSTFTIQ